LKKTVDYEGEEGPSGCDLLREVWLPAWNDQMK
jgi:hypothetical protein